MKELICIVCPKGCHLKVSEGKVTGNSCKRGESYAISELTNPVRMITSTVKVINGSLKRVPVKTSSPISKDLIFKVMENINKITIGAPIKMNQVIIENILNTNINIIATREVEKL